MELSTALIWIVRIVLPVILFWIYFKLQTPQEENLYSTPDQTSISRAKLLACRKATLDDKTVPLQLANIKLVDGSSSKAPAGFSGRPRRDVGRRPLDDKPIPKDKNRIPQARAKEHPEKSGEAAEEAAPTGGNITEEKMHLESLVNYVAFNRKHPQRTFLLGTAATPPPPPRPRKVDTGVLSGKSEAGVANLEAQMVLRGAVSFKRAEISVYLYENLVDSNVEISHTTFNLMIEACIEARDLDRANDLLVKMEAAGMSPQTRLLDKVTELYSEHQEALRKQADMSNMKVEDSDRQAGDLVLNLATLSFEECGDVPRPKLSSQAPIFTPLGIAGEATKSSVTLESSAPPFLPQRTALRPTARPFQPQANAVLDPTESNEETGHNSSQEDDGRAKAKNGGKSAAKRGGGGGGKQWRAKGAAEE